MLNETEAIMTMTLVEEAQWKEEKLSELVGLLDEWLYNVETGKAKFLNVKDELIKQREIVAQNKVIDYKL